MSHDGGGAGHHSGSAGHHGHHGGNYSDPGYLGGSRGRRRNPVAVILRVAFILAIVVIIAYVAHH